MIRNIIKALGLSTAQAQRLLQEHGDIFLSIRRIEELTTGAAPTIPETLALIQACEKLELLAGDAATILENSLLNQPES